MPGLVFLRHSFFFFLKVVLSTSYGMHYLFFPVCSAVRRGKENLWHVFSWTLSYHLDKPMPFGGRQTGKFFPLRPAMGRCPCEGVKRYVL